jgi:hypothetical protein
VWRRAQGGAADSVLAVPFEVRLAALALVLFIPLQNHLRYGQLSLLLLCLSSLFLALHLRRREQGAAAALGGAIALKLTPALFLLYLGREHSYRTAVRAIAWTLFLAVGLPSLISSNVLALYREGWARKLAGLVGASVHYDWRTRFTLAALLSEVWPRLATAPGLRYLAAAAVLGPILWIQPRLARDPRGGLFLFALYLVAMPLVTPVSETHHLAMLAGPLWIWLLAAGSPPHMPVLDGVGAVLALGGHWLGVALEGPAAGRRGSLFDGAALLALYAVLLLRSIRATRVAPTPATGGPSRRALAGPLP